MMATDDLHIGRGHRDDVLDESTLTDVHTHWYKDGGDWYVPSLSERCWYHSISPLAAGPNAMVGPLYGSDPVKSAGAKNRTRRRYAALARWRRQRSACRYWCQPVIVDRHAGHSVTKSRNAAPSCLHQARNNLSFNYCYFCLKRHVSERHGW